LVGDNIEIGVYPISKAREFAREQELDLVEISPKAVPPVCKIIDYKKFLYEQKKREKKFDLDLKQMSTITNSKRNTPSSF
jgi:translation initiation factor IF-3